MVKLSVFNTSPLIFLTKLEFIEQAIGLFDSCLLPVGVCEEISTKKDHVSRVIADLISADKLQIRAAGLTALVENYERRMGRGESEAIVLAMETRADFVILDDSAARREAMRVGLNVKGTLGIVRKLLTEEKIRIVDIMGDI